MVSGIPKRLLSQTVEYEKNLGSDGWDSTYDAPITINYVRVEATSRLQRSSNSEGTVVNHVLFMDSIHTTPFVEINPGDRITFQGIAREVVDVKPFYAFDKLHHYEVELQ